VAGRDLTHRARAGEASGGAVGAFGGAAPSIEDRSRAQAAEAIEQLARRSRDGDAKFVELCHLLPKLTGASNIYVRRAAAQAMGEAPRREGFVQALLPLLSDQDLLLRRLAAESLGALEDPRGREVLLRAMEPHVVQAPFAGRMIAGVELGMRVSRTGQLAFIETEGVGRRPVKAPITGYVDWIHDTGTPVAEGERVAVLLPGRDQIWRALRALYLVGQPHDVERIRKAIDDRSGLGRDVLSQKTETLEMIEERGRRGVSTGEVR
jgi:biotin carboxyl carrier protein